MRLAPRQRFWRQKITEKNMNYQVTDGNGEIEIEADSHKAACQEWADTGDWGSVPKTSWVTCTATDEAGESETHTIKIEPTEPDCCAGSHKWASPLSVVGGIKENPGVYGHGGGVVITCVCRHCGRYQITDTWAQNPENGEQGLTSVEYKDADETSEEWLARRSDAAEEYVREHSDDDTLDEHDLERHFANYFHRMADDDDRKNGLWSLLCQAVGVERD
jgi:hypothetical protein